MPIQSRDRQGAGGIPRSLTVAALKTACFRDDPTTECARIYPGFRDRSGYNSGVECGLQVPENAATGKPSMSKQLFFAFLLAAFGVSIATFQIWRFYTPRRASLGGRIEFVFPSYDPNRPPRAPGRIPILRTDSAVARKLDLADDHLAAESWVEAIYVLQGLLDGAGDSLVPAKRAGRGGQEITAWTGVRVEAARLLDTLPVDGRDSYQTIYGPRAQALLAEARKNGDLARVGEVARRFGLTAAGMEALGLLGLHHLDRGRVGLAASSFQRLLFRPHAGLVAPDMLFYAALAFRQSGDESRAREAWKRLTSQAPGGFALGGKDLSLAELRAAFDAAIAPSSFGAPFAPENIRRLEYRWHHPTAQQDGTRKELDNAARNFEGRTQALVPAFFPIAADGRIVFRSHRGVHAIDGRTGRQAWEHASAWSIDGMMSKETHLPHIDQWLQAFRQHSPNGLFENTVMGTLTSDGKHVYAVDDLALPPYSLNFQARPRQMLPDFPDYPPDLAEAVEHSRLLALDAATGAVAWTVGGKGGDPASAPPLNGCFFLGPPLPLDGRLYAVAEKNSELIVVCLNASGELLWQQFLTVAPFRMLLDPGRRMRAATPVFADGILVCPTNTGLLVGIDMLAPRLVWAYSYPTAPLTQSETQTFGRRSANGPPEVVSEWKQPAIVIQQGRLVLTAPDDPSVHCLNLQDGSLLWTVPRVEDDLYLAGAFGDLLLLVGKKSCRTIELANGKQRWQLETGTPSGRGAAQGPIYFLPLKSAGWTQSPGICALDVRTGALLERTSLPGYDVPGSLLFWDGGMVSQTGMSIRGYVSPTDKTQ